MLFRNEFHGDLEKGVRVSKEWIVKLMLPSQLPWISKMDWRRKLGISRLKSLEDIMDRVHLLSIYYTNSVMVQRNWLARIWCVFSLSVITRPSYMLSAFHYMCNYMLNMKSHAKLSLIVWIIWLWIYIYQLCEKSVTIVTVGLVIGSLRSAITRNWPHNCDEHDF